MKTAKMNRKNSLYILVIVCIVNILSSNFYKRLDLTEDHRYTLSQTTLEAIKNIKSPLYIEVFLEGNLPPAFRKLQSETAQLLSEFSDINPNVKFNFINPLEKSKDPAKTMSGLYSMGIIPTNITIKEGASISEKILFPWSLVSFGKRTIRVNLLKNKLGLSREEAIARSISHLEYAFSTSIIKILTKEKKKIAILKGNAELSDLHIASFLNGLKDSYSVAPFTLDSVSKAPRKTLQQLSKFDLIILAKPTDEFSDEEKQVIDQYVVKGGKMLLLLDQVQADLDSLVANRRYFAFPKLTNLEDMLFKYGVRINPMLVKDISFTNIVLADGVGSKTTYHKVPWQYAPLVVPEENHPINSHIAPIKLDFANNIDTLSNGIKKTVLLKSSKHSKLMASPREIKLEYVLQPPDIFTYRDSNQIFGVLLEGRFSSVYENRIKAFEMGDFKIQCEQDNKIIVIADGDIVKNQLKEGKPLELGFDKWTNESYGNRDFMMNCVNYLLGDTGLLSVRTKAVKIPFLDRQKVYKQAFYWKFFNTAVPIIILLIGGVAYFFIKKRLNKRNI